MRISKTALTVLVASSALALTGCGNLVEGAVNDAVERGVEEAIEQGASGDVDIDLGVEGTASVPDSFPEGFPLPPGNPRFALAVGNVWSLDYDITDESVAMDLNDWYEANGFELIAESDLGELKSWVWQTEEYSATVGLLTADEGFTLAYSLTARE